MNSDNLGGIHRSKVHRASPARAARARWRAAAAFLATGVVAIALGILFATGALHPAGIETAWLVKYLVLIVGLAQIVAGGGQAWLARDVPVFEWVALEWALLNLGNLGVVAGSLLGRFAPVAVGTACFSIAIALFAFVTRHGTCRGWLYGYRMLLALILAASWIGLLLAAGAYP